MEQLTTKAFLAGGAICLFGIVFALLGYFLGRKPWKLVRNGETTLARVVQIQKVFNSNLNSDEELHHDDYYSCRYQLSYTVNGKQITNWWDVQPNSSFRKKYPEGSTLTILYLPESPEKFRVKECNTDIIGSSCFLIIGIGLIFLGIQLTRLILTHAS